MSYTIEKGKLNGGYKVIKEFEDHERSKAWGLYFNVVLKAGQKKRIREDKKTLKQQSCYWT